LKIIYPKFIKILSADCHIATYWQTAEFLQSKVVHGKKFYFVQGYESLWGGEKKRVNKTYTREFEYIVLSGWLKRIISNITGKEALVLVTPVTPASLTFKEGWREKYGPQFRIGFHYVKKRFKGFPEFESAILNLEKEIKNLKVVILTTERRRKFLFSNYEVWNNPQQSALEQYYNSLDLFITTSWYEGLGMTLMEALACKIPIIATDSSGCREFARHLETAYLIKPNSVESIIKGIKALYDDSQLRKKIALCGYNEIQKYSWENNTDKLLEFLYSNSLKKT
ncbi:MAG: glycosyltransferase family 4 protein, partial [Planctomycetota bacterium]